MPDQRPPQQPRRGPSFLDDYVTVHARIERFYQEHETGRIVTEMMPITPGDKPLICFKAFGYRDPASVDPDATGHAIDVLNLNDSIFEKTETAAIGRMLVNMGYGVRQAQTARPKASPPAKPQTQSATSKYGTLRQEIGAQLNRMRGDADFASVVTSTDALAYVNDFLAAESVDYKIEKISDIKDEHCEMVLDYLNAYKEPKA